MLKTQKITLPSKLRILVTPMRSIDAVTVMVLVRAGSRYETRSINGIAHFLEHMFFKGGERYPDQRAVATAIDGAGGEFNAFTGDEYVGYYVKLAKDKVGIAFDVLSDMLMNAKFDKAGLERERGVILEEYNMYEDTPMRRIWDVFKLLMLGDNPLGWSTIGLKPVIKSVQRRDFVSYKNKLYTSPNIVVSVAGNISADQVKKLVKKYLPYGKSVKKNKPLPCRSTDVAKKNKIVYKKTEQAHLVVGVPTFGYNHKDRYVAEVLAAVLGNGMSSRLFTSVRERLGLAYYVGATTNHYADTGFLVARAGVDVKRIDLAIRTILNEFKEISKEKVPDKELTKAKDFLNGRMVLDFEDSSEVAIGFGMQELLRNKMEPIEVMKRKIQAVTANQVLKLAKRIFKDDRLTLAVIGPYKETKNIRVAFKL